MPTAATVPMAARRWEPCVRTIRIHGLDLAPIKNTTAAGGQDLLMQVRLAPDTPGDPLINLPLVATTNTEGLRVTDVTVADGVPVSTIELRINEPTMEGLPFEGEVGDPASFAYGLQVTFANLKKTRMEGQFVVLPGAVGSDAAPLTRPAASGSQPSPTTTWTSVDLTIAGDEVIELTIDGSAELGALLLKAQEAVDAALAVSESLASVRRDVLFARLLQGLIQETIEDGTFIPDLILTPELMPVAVQRQLGALRGLNAGFQETVEDGFAVSNGTGNLLTFDDAGLRAPFASGTIGADAFGSGGVASIRAALPSAIPAGIVEETIGGKQQIRSIAPDGTATTISDGTANDYRESVAGQMIRILSDRSDGTEAATRRPYMMSADGKTLVRQAADPRVFIVVGMGESLMDGSVGGDMPVPGPRALGTALMFNGGVRLDQPDSTATVVPATAMRDLVPLVEAGKQTFMGPLAFRLWSAHGIRSVSINVGVSGMRYVDIKKGTNPYANGIAALNAAIAKVKAAGLVPVPLLVFGMGVNDSGSGSSYTYMQPFMREIFADFTADTRTALNDPAFMPHMFYWTPMSVGGSVTGSWTTGGMAELARENPYIHYAGPLTGIPLADVNHPTGVGQALIGDLLYRPIRDVLVNGGSWTPFMPVPGSGVRSGTSLSFKLAGFTGRPVYLADEASPALSNWGIRVFTSAGAEVTVTGVAFDATDTSKVNLTLAGDPGANAIVTGALQVFGGTAAAADKARTNIADQDPLTSALDGRAFPKRLGQFRLTVA